MTLKGGGLPELALTVRQYAVHGSSGSADLGVSAQSDFGVFRGLRVATPAHLETAAGHTTLTLPGCAPLALAAALARCGRTFDDYDGAPEVADDPAAGAYCPRCHGRYLAHVQSCPDCLGLQLRTLANPQPG